MSDPVNAKSLHGIKVLDVATLVAGPLAATLLGDYGASVIKVEHPRGDTARFVGPHVDGVGLWWKMLGRNKKSMTLDLATLQGQEIFRTMVGSCDVVVENFRPGTMEGWGLGWDDLSRINPRLVMARVTGFGQTGPQASQRGFGTSAEAMSGFAAITGEPDGPPTLPPFALADGVAAITTAFGVLAALRARDQMGFGQVVDTAIIEPLLTLLGPNILAFDQLGTLQQRRGNRSANHAPRNVYQCADGAWVAVSTSAQSVAERVIRLVGRSDLAELPWFRSGSTRVEHADELDEAVSKWIGERDRETVVSAFVGAKAAIAPVYTAEDVLTDPQYNALGSILEIYDQDLGPVRMQNVPFRMSRTPGKVTTTGPRLGEHTSSLLAEYGLSESEVADLRQNGVI